MRAARAACLPLTIQFLGLTFDCSYYFDDTYILCLLFPLNSYIPCAFVSHLPYFRTHMRQAGRVPDLFDLPRVRSTLYLGSFTFNYRHYGLYQLGTM